MRTSLLAVAATLTLGAPMAHAYGGSFQCEDQMDMDQDQARAISGTNNGLFKIVMEYRERWDVAYKRQQCEAFAAGQPYDISCLNDRRDWDAIRAMVPSDYFGMSNVDLNPHYQELQMADDGIRDMADYCRSVGAIK